jgi:lipoprotein-releasing system permease protein
MLVIDKRKDIAVLQAIGATEQVVRQSFLLVGAIVALVGAVVGLALGITVCWVQQTFHVVSMGMATSVVDSYPVKMQASDIFFIALAIISITLSVSIRPALNAGRMQIRENL